MFKENEDQYDWDNVFWLITRHYNNYLEIKFCPFWSQSSRQEKSKVSKRVARGIHYQMSMRKECFVGSQNMNIWRDAENIWESRNKKNGTEAGERFSGVENKTYETRTQIILSMKTKEFDKSSLLGN